MKELKVEDVDLFIGMNVGVPIKMNGVTVGADIVKLESANVPTRKRGAMADMIIDDLKEICFYYPDDMPIPICSTIRIFGFQYRIYAAEVCADREGFNFYKAEKVPT